MATKILQKWLLRRYLLMADNFSTRSFNFVDVEKFLKKNFKDSNQIVSLVLSQLNKAGWLDVKIDPDDSRKRSYSLILMYNKEAMKQLVAEVKEGRENE